ncbi:MAG TPA: lytic transglycosylase domain-containing protein, partial [Polyangiaceae bacterium]|nr:lytic transglycosylase domain-containing protein [Polyangiaceae bacterium]
DRNGARAQFERALHEDRLGYYAQLAARRLSALGETAPAFEATPAAFPRPNLRSLPEEVQFYRKLGLYAEAGDAVTRALGQEADRVRRVAALLETGDVSRIFAAAEPLFDRALEGPPSTDRAWIWQALLPQPYVRTVREQCERQRLDPNLFYGHMQVESHYKAKAVSGADALGLMQLLPETATSVAQELGIEVVRADVTRPYLNITLGAAYLSGLVQRYHGQFPLAIAAYNAGTHKIDEWLARTEEIELDEWVESIPVEQTRNYVRRVISAWSRYHAFSQPDQPWALPLPEKVSLHAD